MSFLGGVRDAVLLSAWPRRSHVEDWYVYRRTHVMHELRYKRRSLRRLQATYGYDSFVETGTHLGETPIALRDLFKAIYTIELSDELYAAAKQKLSPYTNITAIHGDSGTVLPSVVAKLDKPAIFFLDGHYSGAGTALGEKTHPIVEELGPIAASPIRGHIVVIDDASDFTASENNVPLSVVLNSLEAINPNYKFYFDYDMLFALPYEREHREFWRKIAIPFVIR